MKYVSPRFFLDEWPTSRKHLRNFIISSKFVGGDAFWDAYYINRRNCSEGKARKAYVTPVVEAEGVLEMKLNPVWFNVEDMVQVALVNCDEIDPSPSASCCSLIKKMGIVDSFTILASNQRFRSCQTPSRFLGVTSKEATIGARLKKMMHLSLKLSMYGNRWNASLRSNESQVINSDQLDPRSLCLIFSERIHPMTHAIHTPQNFRWTRNIAVTKRSFGVHIELSGVFVQVQVKL